MYASGRRAGAVNHRAMDGQATTASPARPPAAAGPDAGRQHRVLIQRRKRPSLGEQTMIFPWTAGTWRDPDNFRARWRKVPASPPSGSSDAGPEPSISSTSESATAEAWSEESEPIDGDPQT